MKITAPNLLLRLEGFAVLAVSCFAYAKLAYPWGEFGLLFLAPDLFMIGYAFGPRAGAVVYNCAHTYLATIALGLAGWFGPWPWLAPLVLIWTAHIGFDRVLGFGLKYPGAYRDTHFGRI